MPDRMTAVDFIARYEAALATQSWTEVAPLIHEKASVTFSDGSVHIGKAAVQKAFERNFRTIADEDYRIINVQWVFQSNEMAVYLFDFHWTGTINGHPAAGGGRGTSVLVQEGNTWNLLTEHLGPAPSTRGEVE